VAHPLLGNRLVRLEPALARAVEEENAVVRIRLTHVKMDARRTVKIGPGILEKVLRRDNIRQLVIVACKKNNRRRHLDKEKIDVYA
jgi:hypothetical protein